VTARIKEKSIARTFLQQQFIVARRIEIRLCGGSIP